MSAIDWLVISENDLDGEKPSGGFIRAYCHIHGGDHQRSLAINIESGFGQCHCCGAQVLVREINPKAAMNIERAGGRIAAGEIKVRDPKYIARAAQVPKQSPSIPDWQKEELKLLRDLQVYMEKHLTDERARAYIAGRGIDMETAKAFHIGYIPDVELRGNYARIARWRDHIIFPVQTPSDGLHFASRSLNLWESGMDELQHKDILKKNNVEKHLKTHVGGWFNYQPYPGEAYSHAVFCEGAFDALALLEVGVTNTVAIIGTALESSWLPLPLRHITLAFDGDASGIEKSAKARDDLYEQGYDVTVCHAPQDDMGKDWSERYRRYGRKGLRPLLPLSMCQGCGVPSWIITEMNDAYCKGCWRTLGHAPAPGEECCVCGDFSDLLDEESMQPYCEPCWEKRKLSSLCA